MALAVQYRSFGGPEVLELVEVADAKPSAGEVRIAVEAAGLNPVDAKSITGQFPVRQLEFVKRLRKPSRWFGRGPARFPRVLGRDFAGTVEAVGDGVKDFAVGDRVLGTLRSAPGDGATRGSLTTRMVALTSDVVHLPAGLPAGGAAGLGVAAQTACGALRALELDSDDIIVISGASGSVGSVATQLASCRGATVIGVCGPANIKRVHDMGAIPVSCDSDVAAEIRNVAPGPITKFLDCFGGDYVSLALELGVPAHSVGTLVPNPLAIIRGTQFTGSRHAQPGDLDVVADLVANGTMILPGVNEIPFNVEAVRAATADLLNGRSSRKTIVHIP